MLSCLKSYSPQKRNALRSSKKKSGKFHDAKQDQISKIIEHLDRIHQLNTKMISRIDYITRENEDLKLKIVPKCRNRMQQY